ncbi:uncharacterized protein LOC121857240, partial [Homarus americanus]|uniref:uncharacterized protein LOC121857240 n=1 Tax=Homarus americanus TaxID=6706 RepID=UPI001C440A99
MTSARKVPNGDMQENMLKYLVKKNNKGTSTHTLQVLTENTDANSNIKKMMMLSSDEDEPVDKKMKNSVEASGKSLKMEKKTVASNGGRKNTGRSDTNNWSGARNTRSGARNTRSGARNTRSGARNTR